MEKPQAQQQKADRGDKELLGEEHQERIGHPRLHIIDSPFASSHSFLEQEMAWRSIETGPMQCSGTPTKDATVGPCPLHTSLYGVLNFLKVTISVTCDGQALLFS